MTHTVRITMRPDVEVEVSDADYLDLKRQGLLAPAPPAPAKTGNTTTTKAAASSAATKEG